MNNYYQSSSGQDNRNNQTPMSFNQQDYDYLDLYEKTQNNQHPQSNISKTNPYEVKFTELLQTTLENIPMKYPPKKSTPNQTQTQTQLKNSNPQPIINRTSSPSDFADNKFSDYFNNVLTEQVIEPKPQSITKKAKKYEFLYEDQPKKNESRPVDHNYTQQKSSTSHFQPNHQLVYRNNSSNDESQNQIISKNHKTSPQIDHNYDGTRIVSTSHPSQYSKNVVPEKRRVNTQINAKNGIVYTNSSVKVPDEFIDHQNRNFDQNHIQKQNNGKEINNQGRIIGHVNGHNDQHFVVNMGNDQNQDRYQNNDFGEKNNENDYIDHKKQQGVKMQSVQNQNFYPNQTEVREKASSNHHNNHNPITAKQSLEKRSMTYSNSNRPVSFGDPQIHQNYQHLDAFDAHLNSISNNDNQNHNNNNHHQEKVHDPSHKMSIDKTDDHNINNNHSNSNINRIKSESYQKINHQHTTVQYSDKRTTFQNERPISNEHFEQKSRSTSTPNNKKSIDPLNSSRKNSNNNVHLANSPNLNRSSNKNFNHGKNSLQNNVSKDSSSGLSHRLDGNRVDSYQKLKEQNDKKEKFTNPMIIGQKISNSAKNNTKPSSNRVISKTMNIFFNTKKVPKKEDKTILDDFDQKAFQKKISVQNATYLEKDSKKSLKKISYEESSKTNQKSSSKKNVDKIISDLDVIQFLKNDNLHSNDIDSKGFMRKTESKSQKEVSPIQVHEEKQKQQPSQKSIKEILNIKDFEFEIHHNFVHFKLLENHPKERLYEKNELFVRVVLRFLKINKKLINPKFCLINLNSERLTLIFDNQSEVLVFNILGGSHLEKSDIDFVLQKSELKRHRKKQGFKKSTI